MCLPVCCEYRFLSAGTNHRKNDSIYVGLGKVEGITKIVQQFVPLVLADERINGFFSKLQKEEFTALLVAQISEISGGPHKYNR